ncbi:TetR family transcriptional regulator [Frondihabitans sp. VKM Ac-2883]|uniref:TetR family transcriptional regulator n=1 Tax=Frondihabitans sp. VKM Ac-2883 TaxID=2783823 RepID=UPI00188C8F95|nr:TetR family transcriptional regulator [Frondihabitans sp. VKM Ac-2883]MBF4576060.1 TetR family transcriptional regulator [Frondihabitans sp. VKM Ac-2883]
MARRDTPPRERLLLAAHAEFAERGLAGARIDTIARQAEASKERLYAHFKTKRDLFDAALADSLDRWVAAVPMDARDLPGWASRLYLHFAGHRDDARLLLWGQIEGVTFAAPGVINHEELDARRKSVLDAQNEGLIGPDWRPDEVLTLVFGLVLSWFVTPGTTNLHLRNDDRRAAVIHQAVTRLIAGNPLPVTD